MLVRGVRLAPFAPFGTKPQEFLLRFAHTISYGVLPRAKGLFGNFAIRPGPASFSDAEIEEISFFSPAARKEISPKPPKTSLIQAVGSFVGFLV
jgi:hypothetical protein